MLTLGQVAKLTGLSKPTISKYIKQGKISAVKNELSGAYDIDPSEVDRVRKYITPQTVNILQSETLKNNSELQPIIDTLRELIDRYKHENDDLREQRDKWEKVANTLLLTHQKEPEKPANQNEQKPAPPWFYAPPWLWLTLGLTALGGAAVKNYTGADSLPSSSNLIK